MICAGDFCVQETRYWRQDTGLRAEKNCIIDAAAD